MRNRVIAVTIGIGMLCYWIDRPVQSVYFLPDILTAAQPTPGGLHDSVPSFIHGLVFSLLLARVSPSRSLRAVGATCLAWWSIESLLEGLQHQQLARPFCDQLPAWIGKIPVLENLPAYAINGTFDPLDLLFAGLGCLTAFVIHLWLHQSARWQP